jgi:hypothetical protein
MSGRKTFVGGDILLASEVQGFLMDQAVMVFDDSSARNAAIPSPDEGMVSYLKDTNSIDKYVTSWVPASNGFTARQTITATDSSWSVPTLASPIVKVTVIGGGGGGGNAGDGLANGSAGGTSTFNAGGAGSVSASGGSGGLGGNQSSNGGVGGAGFRSSNNGKPGIYNFDSETGQTGTMGGGGQIVVAYLNLSGVSTVNVTIGAGGAGGPASLDGIAGGAGGRGEVVVEYVAG